MFILANLLDATAVVLSMVLWLYMWIVIARAILSWVSPDPHNPIVRFLYHATEPLLYRVRRAVPIVAGGIDLSPLIVIFSLYFLQTFLVRTLINLADKMR
ncbi:MAG: hypothetical protein A3J75_06160 [Acidobacteria bacterium RBG_16_68_9]|nr:MAG: hypothetical protein A3J75_06160 [Acidobacteria bacterium RBG_16_68_9]